MKTPNHNSNINLSNPINGSYVTFYKTFEGILNIVWQRQADENLVEPTTDNNVIRITNHDDTTCDLVLPTIFTNINRSVEFLLPLNYKNIELTEEAESGAIEPL